MGLIYQKGTDSVYDNAGQTFYASGPNAGKVYGSGAPSVPSPAPSISSVSTPNPSPSPVQTPSALSRYTFADKPGGMIDILENGKSIAPTGPGFTAAYASTLGYRPATPVLGTGGELATAVDNSITSTVPSNVFASNTSPDSVVSRATDLYKTYQDTLAKLQTESQPSQQELDARAQIREVNTKLSQGLAKIRTEAIPQPLIGLQSDKLNEQIASILKPLQDEVNTMVEARGARVDAITRVLEATPEMLQMLGSIQALTKPEVLGTQVNDATGDVYSITQDQGTGTIVTTKVGNIGSNNTGKAYVQTGTYQAGDGRQYFYGVKSDGTIENVLLQGAGKAPENGPAGFKLTNTQRSQLLSGGFTVSDFPDLEADIATHGIELAVQGLPSNQADLLRRVLAGSDSVDTTAATTKFITKDYLAGLFTEDALKTAADEAGFTHWYSNWQSEKQAYLDHLLNVVEQYRIAGKTDQEIIDLMQ